LCQEFPRLLFYDLLDMLEAEENKQKAKLRSLNLFYRQQKDIEKSMFIAASFTIAKIGSQPKCPSMDQRAKKR
jgi:hypothetical protein